MQSNDLTYTALSGLSIYTPIVSSIIKHGNASELAVLSVQNYWLLRTHMCPTSLFPKVKIDEGLPVTQIDDAELMFTFLVFVRGHVVHHIKTIVVLQVTQLNSS